MNNRVIKIAVYILYNLAYLMVGLYVISSTRYFLATILTPKSIVVVVTILEIAGFLNLGYFLNKAYSTKCGMEEGVRFLIAKWTLGLSALVLLYGGLSTVF